MMSSGVNPFATQRCPSGRAHSTCAHALSDATAVSTGPPNRPPESLVLPAPAKLRLPAHPPGRTAIVRHRFPDPPATTLQTEQSPLKTDPRAKV